MQNLSDSASNWLAQAGALLGVGGLGAILLKIVERLFKRDDREAADRAAISSELRQDIRSLKAEVRELQAEVEAARQRENHLLARLARTEAREAWSRNRYHRLANWLQSEPGIPGPPAWIFEDIPREGDGPGAPEEPS